MVNKQKTIKYLKITERREGKVNYTKSGQGERKFSEIGRSDGGKANLQIVYYIQHLERSPYKFFDKGIP